MASTEIKRAFNVDSLAKPKGVWSTVAVANPGALVFVSGLLSKNERGELIGEGDVAAQTECVLQNMQTALASAGASLADIVRVDVYVRDISQFDKIHAVRRRFFPQEPPTSTMVEVSRLTDDRCLIEISAIAVIKA